MATLNSGPALLNWTVYAGDSNTETFKVISEDAVDLTGVTVSAEVRATAIDPEIAIAATVDGTNLDQGEFDLSFDGEELRALLAGKATWTGVWDLQIDDGGTVKTWLRGTFEVVHDVTRV